MVTCEKLYKLNLNSLKFQSSNQVLLTVHTNVLSYDPLGVRIEITLNSPNIYHMHSFSGSGVSRHSGMSGKATG